MLIAGVIASLAARRGLFPSHSAALSELFLLYDRARGTFKDPNVLGAFLVLPALVACSACSSAGCATSCAAARCCC